MKKIISILTVVLVLATCCTPAFSDEFLSYACTPLHGASEAKIRNVELAAQRINPTFMATGMVFSFNGLVGPRTKEAGFVTAPNGRGVKVVGGGVAQVASTIYLALKGVEDITILEKHTYGSKFVDDYVTSGDDAIMTDYKGGKDFRFQNSGRPFMLYVWLEGDEVHCELEATEDGEEIGDPGEDPEDDDMMYSSYANLSSFDPSTGIAYFDYFNLLQGEYAVEYMVYQQGYSEAEAREIVDDFADSEFIMDDDSAELRPVDIDNVNLILMFQPDGDPVGGVEGVPSSAGDFYALYEHNPSLLLDSFFYFIYTDEDGDVYLVEQVYWP